MHPAGGMGWEELSPDMRDELARTLTERELVVVKLWLAGYGSRRLALALGVSRTQARDRVDRALAKVERVFAGRRPDSRWSPAEGGSR